MRYLLIVILLYSCSANWHIKRALKKDPSIYRSAIVKTYLDSFIVTTEGAKAETVFRYTPAPRDTFIMERDKFRTVVITDTLWHTLFVETECYPDTVEVVREVPVQMLSVEVDEDKWYDKISKKVGGYILVSLLILLVVLILRYTISQSRL